MVENAEEGKHKNTCMLILKGRNTLLVCFPCPYCNSSGTLFRLANTLTKATMSTKQHGCRLVPLWLRLLQVP